MVLPKILVLTTHSAPPSIALDGHGVTLAPPVNRAPDLEGSALPVVRRLGTPAIATSPLLVAGCWLLSARRWAAGGGRRALGVAAVATAVAAIHSRWLPRSSPLRARVSGLFGSIHI